MGMQQFDPNLPGLIQGEVTATVVIDPADTFSPFEVGNHVLNRADPFQVKVDWELTGLIAKLWLAALQNNPAGNQWDVSVYAESLGGGSEIRLGTELVPVDFNTLAYTATVDVPANVLDEHAPGTDTGGIYKLVVAVFLNSNLGAPGFDITGYNEGPIVQVENPE
jgi:hypothetical protein